MCDICLRIYNAIGELTDEEGSGVNILAANPEFSGSNQAIECCGDWNNFVDQRFEGDTLVDCLESAVIAKRERS